jgi:predicted nucleotidyltransferase
MKVKDFIREDLEKFLDLCRTHDVKTLHAFGSSTNMNFDDSKSDIDLLVELETLDPLKRGENLLDLWEKFELFFHRKVDLLTISSLKNPILKRSIESTKVLLYDGQKQEISR